MGEMADYHSSHDMWDEGPHHTTIPVVKYSEPFTWWTMQSGKRIKVSKMTNSHIQNSINLINRQHGWRESWIEPLKKELKSRTISSEL